MGHHLPGKADKKEVDNGNYRTGAKFIPISAAKLAGAALECRRHVSCHDPLGTVFFAGFLSVGLSVC